MKTPNSTNRLPPLVILLGLLSLQAQGNFIQNGGFESGFSHWSTADQAGSDGSFHLQTGTSSPVNGNPVPPPPGGNTAAMSDAFGPGAHVLYQVFTVDSPVSSAILSFDLFVGNQAEDFFAPQTLDFATPELNQQARVDILRGGADPFSLNPADLLLNVFQTNPGDPLIHGYTPYSLDITTLLNASLNVPLMLRFAETDNVFIFQFGVDNVAIQQSVSVPESLPPAVVFLALLGICGAGHQFAGRTRRSLPGGPFASGS